MNSLILIYCTINKSIVLITNKTRSGTQLWNICTGYTDQKERNDRYLVSKGTCGSLVVKTLVCHIKKRIILSKLISYQYKSTLCLDEGEALSTDESLEWPISTGGHNFICGCFLKQGSLKGHIIFKANKRILYGVMHKAQLFKTNLFKEYPAELTQYFLYIATAGSQWKTTFSIKNKLLSPIAACFLQKSESTYLFTYPKSLLSLQNLSNLHLTS